MEPDFNLRNLEDYTEKDLEFLFDAIAVVVYHRPTLSEERKQALNVWQYRIKDAMAKARKREAEQKDDDSLLSSFEGIFK